MMRKCSTLARVVKAANSFPCHEKKMNLKAKFDLGNILAKNECKLSLRDASTSTHPNVAKMEKDASQMLPKYSLKIVKKSISK